MGSIDISNCCAIETKSNIFFFISNCCADVDSSTLVYSAATTSTPEPTTVFGLLLMGGVGLLSKRQKQGK
ncbi:MULTISPECIES: PEP-CTERM sorting domain-containing protein [Crocosphaera]|uniref:PEP-CTERM sorting domain-containing protein n=1 Tax=Crocosphaera TaxID=263510 RepID=UPI0012F495F2|nr:MULTISPECIES: PEP-CTERM sorting domain-containing protein [Crocosphaera]NQZ63755.1 PEP-CTERM sorting domain-containing protein [Crocosphaera sp.]